MSSASDTRIVRLMNPPFYVAWGRVCAGRHLRVKTALHETLAHPPLVLAQEHAAELGEPSGRIVESSDDPLAILDRQGKHDRPELERLFEQSRGWLIEAGELPNVLVGDGEAGEHHRSIIRSCASPAEGAAQPATKARLGRVGLWRLRSLSPWGRDWVAGPAILALEAAR